MDQDQSGELTTDEFKAGLKLPTVKQQMDLLEMKPADMLETWSILDDGDGFLTIKEFTNGIRRMKGEAKSKDIIDIVKKLRDANVGCNVVRGKVERYRTTMASLEEECNRIADDTGEVLGLMHEMYHRLDMYSEEQVTMARKRERQRKLESLDKEDADKDEAESEGESDAAAGG